MKASPRQQRLLLDLSALDTRAAQLRRRRTRLPERERLAQMQGETVAARERYMSLQRELEAQQAEMDRVASDVAVVRARFERDADRLATSTSSREALALQSEMETLTRRSSELDEREFTMLEERERSEAQFDEASEALARIDERRAALEAEIAAAEEQIDRELAETASERAGLAAELQRDLLALYEQTRASTGIGAARLRGGVSEGSNMALAPGELAEIRRAPEDEILFCPGSGAILVRMSDEESE